MQTPQIDGKHRFLKHSLSQDLFGQLLKVVSTLKLKIYINRHQLQEDGLRMLCGKSQCLYSFEGPNKVRTADQTSAFQRSHRDIYRKLRSSQRVCKQRDDVSEKRQLLAGNRTREQS
jgi:hypothetical protein